MQTKLFSNDSQNLVIFMSGWGCDDIQYKKITSKSDILLCWNYSDLDFNVELKDYKRIDLIAYSAGVFVSGLIKNKLPKLDKRIAINGNLKIFDEYFGITQEALSMMHNLNLDNYMDFRRRFLVFNDEELEYFNQNSSQRSFESCEEELKALEQYYKENNKLNFEFDKAILSGCDKIFNAKHQKEFYNGKYILLENKAHDVFSDFMNLDKILSL
jgi:biotin synthesis protein BioG